MTTRSNADTPATNPSKPPARNDKPLAGSDASTMTTASNTHTPATNPNKPPARNDKPLAGSDASTTTTASNTHTPATNPSKPAGHDDASFSAGVNLKGSLREAMDAPLTMYEIVGGQRFFDELVDRFYDAVERDPLLRPMYPRDMGPSRRRLAGFLAQYWGGPPHYSEERGHPRLRMRHLPFAIGHSERDAWMAHMTASLNTATLADGTGRPLPEEIRAAMFDHFDNAATHLINQPSG